jgi:hypothetical protein
MTSVTETGRRRVAPALGTFERYLTLWVALCIIAGIVLGRLLPAPFQALGRMTVAEVNMRRLRFFGQWDKLKADRSKEA